MNKIANYKFVQEHQGAIAMDLDFYQFAELIDIRQDLDSHFIHSMSESHSEEEIEDEVMHIWLRHFKSFFTNSRLLAT